jgi:hypothetical protein
MHRDMIKTNLTMRGSYISPEAALLDCDYGQALCTSTGLDGLSIDDFSDGETIIW